MLDSGVRLAAASLPVGVPVVVGLVVAVLRRRDLPAVATPAIAGLAVQLVVVLLSTFLVAATSFGLGLTPETLLPLSSVLGFVVILLQVVSWTLLLLALFRRLPRTAPTAPQRDDRTPTGRHALLDDRGDQVVAEAGTVFLPVGAAAGAAGAGVGLGAAAATAPAAPPRDGPPTGPRPAVGPPPARPAGPPPPGMPPGPDPSGPPLPSVPLPVQDAGAPDGDEPADTETFAAYGTPPAPAPDEQAEETPEQTPEAAADPEDEHYPGYLQDAPDGAGEPDDGADTETTEYPGYLEGVAEPAEPAEPPEPPEAPEAPAIDDEAAAEEPAPPPGEDVDEEPVADADPEVLEGTEETDDEPADEAVDEPADEPVEDQTDDPAEDPAEVVPAGNGVAASAGHPWFDPDGEAARSQEARAREATSQEERPQPERS